LARGGTVGITNRERLVCGDRFLRRGWTQRCCSPAIPCPPRSEISLSAFSDSVYRCSRRLRVHAVDRHSVDPDYGIGGSDACIAVPLRTESKRARPLSLGRQRELHPLRWARSPDESHRRARRGNGRQASEIALPTMQGWFALRKLLPTSDFVVRAQPGVDVEGRLPRTHRHHPIFVTSPSAATEPIRTYSRGRG